jgi:hypothetical protein
MSTQDDVAVLLIIFNRPEKTRQVINRLAEIKPSRLYISADGPRHNNASDHEGCKASRAVIETGISWSCSTRTRFSDNNLGCKDGVSSAIDWFFRYESEGIILEDDCLPHPEFFGFCRQLLNRYRNEERVWIIAGDNSAGIRLTGDYSYAFITEPLIWGWATWKRAWNLYDRDMQAWQAIRDSPLAKAMFDHNDQYELRRSVYDRVSNGEIDTWDYQLSASMRARGGLCIVPRANLISNIGFDAMATHTKTWSERSNASSSSILPLHHPPAIISDPIANEDVFTSVQGGTRSNMRTRVGRRVKGWIKRSLSA